MISHIDWTITIAKTVLNRNRISVEDYIDTVTTPGMAIDPVCVLVLARMFHFHAVIFLKKGVWSTCKDKSLKKCHMGLIFHGGSNFSETVKIGESDSYQSFLDKYTKQGVLLSHLHSKTPGGAIQVKPVPATQPDTEPTDCESSDDVANDMDIPTGLNDTDLPQQMDVSANVSQASSAEVLQDNNASDASSEVIIVNYETPP